MTTRPILLDEGADRRLIPWLRSEGCDVTAVAVDYPAGLEDREILMIARLEGRLVLTNDTDFGDLVFRQGMPHTGVILLRLRSISLRLLQSRIRHVLTVYSDRLDRFFTVTEDDVRVR